VNQQKKFHESTVINWNIKLKIRDYFMLLFPCMSQWIYFHVMIFNMKHMRTFSYCFLHPTHIWHIFLLIHLLLSFTLLVDSSFWSYHSWFLLSQFFFVLYFHLSVYLLSFRLHAIKINKFLLVVVLSMKEMEEIRNFND